MAKEAECNERADANTSAFTTPNEARRVFDERIERLLSQHGIDYVRGYVDALKDCHLRAGA